MERQNEMEEPRVCDNCGHTMAADDIPYWVRLEIFASPEPPTITDEDLAKDHAAEMRALIDKMEQLGPEECEAQVFEAYEFVICPACRTYFHEHLKHRRHELS